MHADNGALVQNLMRVVAEIRWPEVDEAERSAWLSEIDASFDSGTDAHFVSVAAIVELRRQTLRRSRVSTAAVRTAPEP